MIFQFANPWLLGFLIVVPLLATLSLWRRRSTQPAVLTYGYTQLTRSPRRSWRIRMRPTLRVFRILVVILVVIALARPQAGEAEEIISGEGVDIAIALDISSSMASLDFEPQDRLEAAKQIINNFIAQRDKDRIGLIVFAEEAFVQSPLTVDKDVLSLLVDEVELAFDLSIDEGSAIGLGLVNAANLLKDSEAESKVIVLVTDGVNTTGEIDPLTAAAAIEAIGIRVHAIGMGRTGLVPYPSGDSVVFQESELDEETMGKVAETTGGLYFRAEDTFGLQQVYDQIDQLETTQIEVQNVTRFQDLAQWFLIAAIALLCVELFLGSTVFRRIP